MKDDIKSIQLWIDALRSGAFPQTKERLQDKRGYCCLGVACNISMFRTEIEYTVDGFISGATPSYQDNCPVWLLNIESDFYNKTKKYLINLNDEENFSFNEIADLIEAVYILKVLD